MKDKRRTSRLRILREARGLSLREVARIAGIDVGQLSRLERGGAGASIQTAIRLARVLGLTDAAKALKPFISADDE
jgi:transcriptional regulator with XRE-family HTH domain